MSIRALLFDLDGTPIHSMPLHGQSWRRWQPFDVTNPGATALAAPLG